MKSSWSVLLLVSLAASAVADEPNFLSRLNNDSVRSAIAASSLECTDALDVFEEPRGETTPSQRHSAAITVRQCLKEDRARQMANDDNAALAYQISSSHIESVNRQIAIEKAGEEFRGISFGVGVGVSFSDDDIISSADVDSNNIIRATKDESTQPRVILESHYYDWCKTKACNEARLGIGPYFGIVAKDDKLISAFSAGVMFGWKNPMKPSSAGFSIGLGAILDSDVQSLADGFEDGEPLPVGETAVRFKTESRWGAILFFTRTF